MVRKRRTQFNTLVQSWSGGILLILVVLLVVLAPIARYSEIRYIRPGLFVIMLGILGAVGAIVSNMVSKQPFLVSQGPTRRYFVYHLLARPMLGAFSALFFYLLARSGILFEIAPQRGSKDHPAISIVVRGMTEVYFTYAAFAVAFGFAADKILGSTIDSLLARLVASAEKGPSAASTGATGRSQD